MCCSDQDNRNKQHASRVLHDVTFTVLLIPFLWCRWGRLLPFHGLRIFPGGVMDLAYVKGFEHRSMAVGLPYVLHNLIPATGLGERLAVSYAMRLTMTTRVVFNEPVESCAYIVEIKCS